MATYDFGPEIIPYGRTPIECNFEDPHEDEGSQTFNGIYAKSLSGHSWCAACGRQRYKQTSVDEVCRLCSTKADPFVAQLVCKLVGIKVAFRDQLLRERQGGDFLRSFQEKCYGNKKYMEASFMHQQCATSLIRVADALRLEFPVGDDSHVTRISEIEFSTKRFYDYTHCAFVLFTDHGAFVFDPTGAQFGPRWPTVTTFRKYVPACIRTWTSIEPVGTRKQKYLSSGP